ncbi:MAG: type II toxin-antitoxin system VapC family toxin [Acidobacteriia bacterium]|nr:type II toxin-antitoxin system VapC family toxin [Terriglobia bacterium]
MFALDTNTLIFFFKGAGRVGEHLRNTTPREIGIPSIVLYELEVGVALSPQRENRHRALDAFLEVTRVLPFDEDAARAAATLRRTLEQAGTPIGPLDTLIAGTALAHSAILVTRNAHEFGRVRGLKMVDWF